jgi:predicted amidohydrolase YtcJ
LISRGLPLAGSSDAPFDPVDPWRGMRAAVSRTNDEGGSANPSGAEALPPEEALYLYTAGAARALGEPQRGQLEPGDHADLVVLSVPDLASAVSVGSPAVRETWVDGRRVTSTGG